MARDSSKDLPRFFPSDGKQVRNRYSSAGITAREADSLAKYMLQIRKISQKRNLYIGYESRLEKIADAIQDLLIASDRL